MTISNRTFGVEIEFVGDRSRAVRAIQDAGVECSLEGYNHYTRSTWKCVTDGSVSAGGEIVSPILRGEEGIATLKTVLRALAGGNFRVNATCGIHVHVGARDLNVSQIRTIVKRYAHNESIIDSMMPRSRRGRNNQYCQPVSYANNLDGVTTVDSIVRSVPGRYYKVNLMSIARHGTIEFRQHSGSLNSSKVANWVRFCVNFVETTVSLMAACDRTTTVSTSAGAARPSTGRSYRRGSKAARVLSLLGSSTDGCDADYLANRVGSTRSSVMVMISNMRSDGHTITRRHGRYYLQTTVASAATPARPAAFVMPREINLNGRTIRTGRANSVRRAFFQYLVSNRCSQTVVGNIMAPEIENFMRTQYFRRPGWNRLCDVVSEVKYELGRSNHVSTVKAALGCDGAVAPVQGPSYDTVVRTDCFQGLDRSIVSFFQERIQDLAS